jgi:hypothetical protein
VNEYSRSYRIAVRERTKPETGFTFKPCRNPSTPNRLGSPRSPLPGNPGLRPGRRHGHSKRWFREDTEVIDFFAPPRDDFLLGGKPAYMSEGAEQLAPFLARVFRREAQAIRDGADSAASAS